MRAFEVNYGERRLQVRADPARVAFDLQPRDAPTACDAEALVRRALREPVGSPPLRDLLRRGQKVVILGDDQTRLTPTHVIVPVLLDEINAGCVPDDDVTLVIATGTHRPLTAAELDRKYGPRVINRIRVRTHDCLDGDSLAHFGVTRRGTDIWVSRAVVEADVRIGVGNIVPHHPTGWSGGAKILLPGVAGRHTTGQMHLLGATEQQLGKVDTPCREEMEDFARQVRLDCIVNTVLDRRGRMCGVVAGHYVAAHRRGVDMARQVMGVPFDRQADIVLASTYPIDFDLFQADKGLFSAAIGARLGGEILLLSPCHDGVSPTHPEAVPLAALDDDELWRLARAPGADDPLSIAEALYFNTIKRSFRATLVTEGIPRDVVEAMGFHYLAPDRLPAYVEGRMAAEPGLTLGILRNSVDVLPVFQSTGGNDGSLV
ncbi:MAG: nickel-dependent lactate racemase [Candidatus Brocadiae bacterium]|nr:nickel-dependent lactate racemase [Candidatus Brocadiia bacterium]